MSNAQHVTASTYRLNEMTNVGVQNPFEILAYAKYAIRIVKTAATRYQCVILVRGKRTANL